MRPGPGLVVMALAFISGARRGSTSTSSKISSSTSSSASTLSSSSPSSYSPSSTSTSEETQPSSVSILFPSFLGGGGVLTPTDSPTTHQRERTNTHPTNDYNHFYHNSYPPLSFVLPEHLRRPHYDNSRGAGSEFLPLSSSSSLRTSKETRRSRSIGAGTTADDRSSDIVGRAGGGGGGGGDSTSKISTVDDDLDVDTSDSSAAAGVEGLLVQFPSHSADSSTSFDEDDILALVAEDDLLSEESFDRLTQLTDDDKIGYINEEDYSGTEGVSSSSGSESSFSDGENQHQQQQQPQKQKLQDESSHISIEQTKSGVVGSGEAKSEDIYAAHLVTNNDISALAVKAPTSESAQSLSHTAEAAESKLKVLRRSSIFESVAPLTRLNPWISACDLAQPGTAPDLQGQCSAGTLPVARVDEGPGPPTCPKSCEQLRLNNKKTINSFNLKTNDNTIKYLMNTNPINFKSNYNNNKIIMTKVRRDVSADNGISNAESERTTPTTGATATMATTTATQTMTMTAALPSSSSSSSLLSSSSAATYAQDAAMQQDGIAAVVLNRQSQKNNDIVKMNANHDNSLNNNLNFINNELKYNHLRQDQHSNNNKNNNNNNNNKQQRSNSDEQQQQQQQEEEQQCLDYLGDTEITSPIHLCSLKSPSDLVERLRSLRLKHCCERNVFSALHTVALNATLNGGTECVRVLSDVMELDSLATRITCEVAEILFRFDCRQTYSLIHQCDDCKEAYRRWVCSTLVPYFAGQEDVMPAPGSSSSTSSNNTASNIANNNSAAPTTTTTNFTLTKTNDDVNNKNKKLNLIDNTNKSRNNNKLINDNYKNKRTKRHSVNNSNSSTTITTTTTTASTAAQMFIDVFKNYNNNNNNNKSTNNNNWNYATSSKRKLNDDGRCIRKQQQQEILHLDLQHKLTEQTQQQQQQQSNNFISTANSEDPCPEDPVISKLLKRSKRKVEFRKRRRIRPCLNVCQTVEQKCPYLLPADRAPALPTQYAGEPTFLCLDQNIPETGEQLRRSGHGPADCCYSYCYGDPRQGVCTYCNEFGEAPAPAAADFVASATLNANANANATTSTRRVHNYTLTATTTTMMKKKQQQQQHQQRLGAVVANNDTHARSASVAIALKNANTTATTDNNAEEERLPYYAYYEGIYYYDDDTQDMPAVATSGDCPVVPSVTSRCTIPYYASSYSSAAAPASSTPKTLSALIGQQLLLWLSAMLCLLSSYHAAAATTTLRQQRSRTRALASFPHANNASECRRCGDASSREIIAKNDKDSTELRNATATTTVVSSTSSSCTSISNSCSTDAGSSSQSNSKCSQVRRASSRYSRKKIQKYNMRKTVQKQNIYKFSKIHFSSNIKFYRSKNSSRFSTCTSNNIITITSNNYANKTNNNKRNKNKNKNNTKHNNKTNNEHNNIIIKNSWCCYYNSNNNKNYRLFYYYNFNINDWWRRWWWIRIQGGAALLS